MLHKKITLMLIAFATTFSMVPALALAHNGNEQKFSQQDHAQEVNKDRDRDNDHDRDFNERKNLAPRGIVQGKIVTKTATGFTLKGRMDTVVTVDTTSAVITKVPNQTILLAGLTVGDYVSVLGTKVGLNVVATKVFMVPTNISKEKAKGTVTAVTPTSVTVQSKNGNTVTAQTDTNTKIVTKTGVAATMSDIIVGSKVKISGIWDSITNIFTALTVRIK